MNAEIVFQSTSKDKGQIIHTPHGKKPIIFRNGQFKTSDREQINELLNSSLISRGYIEPVTPPELIEKWLLGEQPDRLTKDVLAKVSDDGLKELAKIAGLNAKVHKHLPELIRSMLKGKAITNGIMYVLEKYEREQPAEHFFDELEESGLIYRSGPWYKYRKGKEPVKDDLTLGKTEAEAHTYVLENRSKIEKRLKDLENDNT